MVMRKIMIATLAICLIACQQAEARVKLVAPSTSKVDTVTTTVSRLEKANKIVDYASYAIVAAGLLTIWYVTHRVGDGLIHPVTAVHGKCEVSDNGKFAYTIFKALGAKCDEANLAFGAMSHLLNDYTHACLKMMASESYLQGKNYLRIGN